MVDLTNYAKEILAKDNGFIASNNYRVIKVEENYCELEGIVSNESYNPYGFIHGGYIFGLADTAAGIAANTVGKNAVTINSSIEYFKAGKSDKIVAIAKCLKFGKNISFYEVSIYDNNNNLISKANINYFFVDKG